MKTTKNTLKLIVVAALIGASSILSSCTKSTTEKPIRTFTLQDFTSNLHLNADGTAYVEYLYPMYPSSLVSGNSADAVVTVTVNKVTLPATIDGINFKYTFDNTGMVTVISDKKIDYASSSNYVIVVSLTTNKY